MCLIYHRAKLSRKFRCLTRGRSYHWYCQLLWFWIDHVQEGIGLSRGTGHCDLCATGTTSWQSHFASRFNPGFGQRTLVRQPWKWRSRNTEPCSPRTQSSLGVWGSSSPSQILCCGSRFHLSLGPRCKSNLFCALATGPRTVAKP